MARGRLDQSVPERGNHWTGKYIAEALLPIRGSTYLLRFEACVYSAVEGNVITFPGRTLRPSVTPMQRRTFMNLTTGAIGAVAFDFLPLAAAQQGKTPVAYPDPAVEIVDPRFAKYRIQSAA